MAIDLGHANIQRLKKSIRENPGNFVAMVGAGLSMPAKVPSWAQLKTIVIDDALTRSTNYPADERESYIKKLERLRTESDYWRLFENLKQILGRGDYELCIKDAITLPQGAKIPDNYKLLWKLNIGGMITTNIDNCSINSFAEVFRKTPDHATGKQATRYSYFLSGGNRFVFQPHGTLQDTDSWVFTSSELSSLLKNCDYIDFTKNVFSNRSTIIIGLNIEDFSLKYILQNILNGQGRLNSPHYAIFNKPTSELIREYSEKNIFVIPYSAETDEHYEIQQLLNHILEHSPTDNKYGSVFNIEKIQSTEYDHEQLSELNLDELRIYLNKKVSEIISPETTPTEEQLSELESFYRNNVRLIHSSWLLAPNTECDQLFGYKVLKRVGKGAFGQVYEAENVETNERIAIKLLLPELKDHREYLNSFRRGVRSMQILTSKNIDGMVKLFNAYEIPACIFMEFVDGQTLREAIKNGSINNLSESLNILHQTGIIVRKGHELEELVLHRDLKPDNIILKDFFGNGFDINVIVLDFDLSWHKGALDLSIVDGAIAQGYAAPEQTASFVKGAISTRHTAVDVFGFGMVCYYVLTGSDPRPNEQNFKNFKSSLKQRIEEKFNFNFISLPEFLSDIIYKCTLDVQSERISFDVALESIENALYICSSDSIKSTNPLLLLEIAIRVDKDGNFSFSDFGRKINAIYRDESKPLEIYFSDKNHSKYLSVKFFKTRNQYDDRNITRYLETAKQRAESKLREAHFINIKSEVVLGSVNINADYKLSNELNSTEIYSIVSTIMDVRAALDLR